MRIVNRPNRLAFLPDRVVLPKSEKSVTEIIDMTEQFS